MMFYILFILGFVHDFKTVDGEIAVIFDFDMSDALSVLSFTEMGKSESYVLVVYSGRFNPLPSVGI